MIEDNVSLKSLLKSSGNSLTKQRLEVFDALLDQEPMSMNQLILKLGHRINRASIYRTIDLFEKLGIVQRINMGWKYKVELTDKFSSHHHHLSCLSCGKIIPISEAPLEEFINKLATGNSFSAQRHQIEIQGVCKDCR